jgi:hypothetical protein
MWIYEQRTGWLYDGGGKRFALGYSGKGEGKNNPDMQDVHKVGPLPCGVYTPQPPVDSDKHGKYVLWLVPDPSNEMFDRDAFGMHGDSIPHPGEASEGCIIQARFAREAFWNSGEQLRVVADIVAS